MIYSEIVLLTIILISLLQRGFFWSWLRARLNSNKTILIKCWGGKKPYYLTGKIENNPQRIIFKDMHSKQVKSIMISNPKTQIHIDMGVQWVEVDTLKDCVIDYSEMIKAINGHDGEKYEGLCLRHLYRPSIMDDQLKRVFWIGIISLVLIGANLYYTYKITKGLAFVSQQVADTCGVTKDLVANMTHTII
jgi:hypothetical protein